MSYDPLNTDERDWSAHDDTEGRFQCAECQDWCRDDDPSNVRIGREWFCVDCGNKHPAVVGDTMAAILADEQQDHFNRTRR